MTTKIIINAVPKLNLDKLIQAFIIAFGNALVLVLGILVALMVLVLIISFIGNLFNIKKES